MISIRKTREQFIEAFFAAPPSQQRSSLAALLHFLPYSIVEQALDWFVHQRSQPRQGEQGLPSQEAGPVQRDQRGPGNSPH